MFWRPDEDSKSEYRSLHMPLETQPQGAEKDAFGRSIIEGSYGRSPPKPGTLCMVRFKVPFSPHVAELKIQGTGWPLLSRL